MNVMRMIGATGCALLVSGLILAGDAPASGRGGPGGPRKAAAGEQGGEQGGPRGEGDMGPRIFMEKDDVKAEFEKFKTTLDSLKTELKTLRESTRAAIEAATDEAGKTAAADAARTKAAELFGKIIDERIRHQEAMVTLLKKYRDEIVKDMQDNMKERGEKRGERRDEMKGGRGDMRGKMRGPGQRPADGGGSSEESVF